MKKSETARLMAVISAVDGREINELSVEAWSRLLGDVDYLDALEAVQEHYRTESRRIWPADIRRGTVDSVGQDEWAYRA